MQIEVDQVLWQGGQGAGKLVVWHHDVSQVLGVRQGYGDGAWGFNARRGREGVRGEGG